jgi:small subunit ribosomal protein S20
MAHSISATKRIRQNAKRKARNSWAKVAYRTAIKDFRELLLHGSNEQCDAALVALYKLLDQVASTPALHKNTASRYKSRLTLAGTYAAAA